MAANKFLTINSLLQQTDYIEEDSTERCHNIVPGFRGKDSKKMNPDLIGKVQTVAGCIEPKEAGITLVHEHLCCNASALGLKPESDKYADYCDRPLTQDIGWWITHNPYSSSVNARHFEEKEAIIEEVKFFKSNGGGTLVDNTTVGLDRDVNFLEELAAKTGVNIIAGTGYYVNNSRPQTWKMSVEDMSNAMMRDLTNGFDGTSIKAGVIGEIGCSWPLTASEKNAVIASAEVECATGCPVIIHPGRDPQSPFEVVRIYQEAGGHVDRVVMSHLDRTFHDMDMLVKFAEVGTYLDYDLFGIETSYFQLAKDSDMPSDAERMNRIAVLIKAGFQDRITIAQDIHTKHRLMKYGGHGYSHILLHVVPKMLIKGISQECIDKILLENPQRWLTFKKHT